MSRRYVLRRGDAILLIDWTWIRLEDLLRWLTGIPVWVFPSRQRAEQARRSYGRGAWRAMAIVRITRG